MNEKSDIYFITYIRACAAIMIFFCHIFNYGSEHFSFIAQFLNIGVNIFFLISGILFGMKGNQDRNCIKWYFKRIKRIYIPYEMFLGLLGIIHIVLNIKSSPEKWILTILGIQEFNAVLGAEQAWYITDILACYLLTPFISKVYNLLKNRSKHVKAFVLMIMFTIQVLVTFISDGKIILISSIIWYSVAYILGRNLKQINITLKRAAISFFVMCVMFSIRLISRYFIDGTILYNNIIVSYTQYIASICIIAIFMYLFSKKRPIRLVRFISDISFEIYLYHCWFMAGPIVLLGKTNIVIDTIIIAILTIIIAYIMNRIYRIILNTIEKRK